MNKKQLAIQLSRIPELKERKVELEQYQLEGELAAELLWKAYLYGDIEGKTVGDFGSGNGILGIGAQLLGAKKVHYIDIDKEALDQAEQNSEGKGVYHNIDVVEFSEEVDTVIMNPPFGVQERKADKAFLEKAMECSKVIYSLHKIESKKFIQKLAEEHKWEVVEIQEEEFRIKRSYKFHKKDSHQVEIGLWKLRKL